MRIYLVVPRVLPLLLSLLVYAGCKSPKAPIEVTAGAEQVQLELKTPITCGIGGPGGIAAGTKQGAVLFAKVGGAARTLGDPKAPLHAGAITALDLSADGKHLLSGGGKTVVYWDTRRGEKVRQLRGPQPITSAALYPTGNAAFFGTDQGHVLRWRLDQKGADGIKAFACGGARVHTARMNLPIASRCRPYGTYFETPAGMHICLYPVTRLLRSGDVLLRACRSGTLGFLDLKKQSTEFYQAGHLSAFAAVGRDRVLLGRADGKVQLYRRGELKPQVLAAAGKAPAAVAADRDLLAVAAGGVIHLWHREHATVVASLKIPAGRTVRWLGLKGRALQALYDDGRLVRRELTVKPLD
jgi:WD domain, G-beta repeat